jgi:hypothetical protein
MFIAPGTTLEHEPANTILLKWPQDSQSRIIAASQGFDQIVKLFF